MRIDVEQATVEQVSLIGDILAEAARWAERRHGRLWVEAELDEAHVRTEVEQGQFYLALSDGEPAGTIRYQLVDELFWPDAVEGESAYVHRLAVRRRFAGLGIADALLAWAAWRARADGLSCLRLDTDITRPGLRRLYERCGFREHSERKVGPYHVMRYEMRLESING